ncbi:MAG: IS630 family transposase [Methanomassiliicoccaceae archaeon]|nr:IS630 family transposase [Methanomassiliicoccaceae archaeon]
MIGFFDEASPQTTANTVRKWSKEKPRCIKNTDKVKANAIGFYEVNGTSLIEFPQRSKSEDVCACLENIRDANGSLPIVIVLDNFSAHHSKMTAARTEELNIHLVFLPPYSPHLNPIEFLWKSTKRVVSKTRIISREHMTGLLSDAFATETAYCVG